MKQKYVWLFSDTEFNEGKWDIHFILNTETGEVKKCVIQRTKYVNDNKETLLLKK